MAYRVGLPKNKENFLEKPELPSSASLLNITGNSGNTGNKLSARNGAIGDSVAKERAKLEASKHFPGRSDSKEITCDLEAGEIVGVMIASEILGAEIWLAFRNDFNPKDKRAIFFAHELPALKGKTFDQLRKSSQAEIRAWNQSHIREGGNRAWKEKPRSL